MTTENQTPPAKAAKPPVAKFRSGPVTASIWEVEGKKGKPFHVASFERFYRAKDGEYKTVHTYRGAHLLDLSTVAKQALDRIVELDGGLKAYEAHGDTQDEAEA